MSRGILAALDNLQSVITTRGILRLYDGTEELVHRTTAWDETDLEDDPTRTCGIFPSGERLESGEMLQHRDPGTIDTSVDVAIVYPAGTDAWALLRLIAEDIDTLANRVTLPSLWDTATTGIVDRSVTGHVLSRPTAPGKGVVVTLNIAFGYQPLFE